MGRSRLIADVDFERDGVQHGFVRLFHSVHSSAYGFIPIPIVVIRNGAGPTTLLISGTHGDEYEGQVALCDLVRSLDARAMSGRVIVLPTANYHAAIAGRRTSPVDDGNLNRLYPGDPDGTPTEQTAYWVEHDLVPMADFVCDLHSGGSSLTYLPSTLMTRHDDADRYARNLAALQAFGAPYGYVQKTGPGQGGDRTTSGAAERAGKLSLGTELGGGGTVTPEALRVAKRGLVNLLVHLGHLPESRRVPLERPTRLFTIGGQDHFVYASEPGVYEPLVELGDTVVRGQPAALVHTPETPWRRPTEMVFEADGFVLCKRVPGRTTRGDCLFHLGTDLER